jgi:hypothetical protein
MGLRGRRRSNPTRKTPHLSQKRNRSPSRLNTESFVQVGIILGVVKLLAILKLATAMGILVSAASAVAAPSPSPSPAEEDLNNGEDFTRPPARYELRSEFQEKSNNVTQDSLIIRRDQPFTLDNEWKLAMRLEMPLVLNDTKSAANRKADTRFGPGDLLFQAALIETLTERFAWGAGARVLFPTASQDQLGGGKYQLLPILGARYMLPEISAGSFAEVVARYDFDLAGSGERNHVSRFQLSPTLSVALPERWFFTLYPSQDIVVNLIGGSKWFVPADFSIGRNLSKRTVVSLEVSVPIVKEFVLYEFKLQARFGFSF